MPEVSCTAAAIQNSSEWPCSMCPFLQLRLMGVRASYIYFSNISWTPWVLDPITNPYWGPPSWLHPVTVWFMDFWFSNIWAIWKLSSVCSFCGKALVCLKWNFGYSCSLLASLSFKDLVCSLLSCSHRKSSVFVIWTLCHLKLVKVFLANVSVPPFTGLVWEWSFAGGLFVL